MVAATAMARGRAPGGGGGGCRERHPGRSPGRVGGGAAAGCDDDDGVVSLLDPRWLVLLGLVRGHGTQEFLDR